MFPAPPATIARMEKQVACRSRRRRNRAGAARAGAARARAPTRSVSSSSSQRFDLSLANRRATGNAVVTEAATAIREHGLGLKAPTITPEIPGDVGSPNRILREQIGAQVIVRTGRRIPGVTPIAGVHAPIAVVQDGRRRRLRRRGVARGHRRRRGRLPQGADRAPRLPRRRRVRLPRGREHGGDRLRRPQVHGQPGLRGHVQGRARRGRRAAPRRPLRPAADRRHLCAAARGRGRAAGDSGAQSRRRHPLRSRAADVRLDRRRRVAGRGARRQLRSARG